MKIYDAMRTLRAVRKLRPDPIPEDMLKRIFEAATWAPNGGNRQPWRMIAVRDAAAKRRMGELYTAQWAPYAVNYAKAFPKLPGAEVEKHKRTLAAGDYLAAHMHEAPVLVVVCFNPALMAVTDAKQDRVSVVGGGSVYPAVENLLLAARAEGLGCVLTTLLCADEPEIKRLLDIPAEWGTAAMIPLGYPVGQGHGPISRKPVSELFYNDKWGKPYA
ncbi:MAG: nitroreductase family protein [Alphaproteobacteria bacterium]|nr:nitroreductase family protein [Alphaproteobacteria bacterium]